MGRRILAFFLGFIFAFVMIAGGIAIAVFAVKVNQYAPSSDKYLGDLANMSVYNVGQSIYKLYADKKTWVDENGKYYSLGDFCENYNIDINAAFGTEVPKEVLDIPAFEYFNDGGMDRAMQQIKVSTLPAVINMFGGKNEDGSSNGAFSDDVVAELSKYSMFDLLKDENVGIAGVFANIRFADVMPSSFPAEDTDNKLMWAVGQTKIGGLLNGMSGSDSILLQLKAGGAFETLGGLALSSVLGESQYVNAILGSDAVFADLIDDKEGTIKLDEIINGVSVGELLGCQKNEITELDGYVADAEYNPDEPQIMFKGHGDEIKFVKSVNNGENWYKAELKCDNSDEAHSHNADCYKYVWYSTTECTKEHDHAANGDMNKDGVNYARTDGLYSILAAMSITDLTSGNTDALMDEIKLIKISDVIDATQVDGIMNAFVDLTIKELMDGAIDYMYLGEFFSFERDAIQNINDYLPETERINKNRDGDDTILAYYVKTDGRGNIALSFNEKDWYVGKSTCDDVSDTHVHHENCYQYVWYQSEGVLAEGVQNKLASKQIADLRYLNDEVKSMTLLDVFGEGNVPEMLKSIANVEIGKLSEHIDTILLGELLGYGGGLICTETHEHGYDCYAWTNGDGTAVTGIMAKLACKTVDDMNNMGDIINGLKLSDVLDPIPDVLKSLANVEIGGLNDAINSMRLGDFLEYEKRYNCAHTEGEEHDETCEYAWYQLKCANAEGDHVHSDVCYVEVAGMMAKLANKRVSELNTLDSMVQEFTLRDVLGENIPTMLLDVADTQINKVGDAIQGIYLGSALGYARKEVAKDVATSYGRLSPRDTLPIVRGDVETGVYYMSEDGETWYAASASTKNETAVYGYVWYETNESGEITDKEVSGIVKALVNSKVGNVSSSIETMTLGEMGIGGDPEKPNRILDALQDTPINEIGDAINNMQMATVLGYEKHYTCGLGISTDHPTHADCPYVWVDESGKKATGLNAIIAEKYVKEMTGDTLTTIAQELTVGDLIDSGMIVLEEEEEYKLAIIFSDGGKGDTKNQHSFTETVLGEETEFKCNFAGYTAYQTAHIKDSSVDKSAKGYWYKCHGFEADHKFGESEIAHRDTWKAHTLKEFVNKLLENL